MAEPYDPLKARREAAARAKQAAKAKAEEDARLAKIAAHAAAAAAAVAARAALASQRFAIEGDRAQQAAVLSVCPSKCNRVNTASL